MMIKELTTNGSRPVADDLSLLGLSARLKRISLGRLNMRTFAPEVSLSARNGLWGFLRASDMENGLFEWEVGCVFL